ncbi:MAG: hypothetical protein MJ107_05730 [Lachnospiraceae bacterium]|nr:hypothetical protein [Lachnospiraceae bacterium]
MISKPDLLKAKRIIFVILAALITVFLILAVPCDCFFHGFYCTPLSTHVIDERDFLGTYNLSQGKYEMLFSPTEKHLSGIEINLANVSGEGSLIVSTYSNKGKLIESHSIELNNIPNEEWYIVEFDGKYKDKEKYTMIFEAVECDNAPEIRLVDNGYLPKENLGSQVLISYGYSKSTFNDTEKMIMIIFSLSVILFLFGEAFLQKKKISRVISLFFFLTALFTENFMFNSFCGDFIVKDTYLFEETSIQSEYIVEGVIKASQDRVALNKYGLGVYMTPFYDMNDETDKHGLSTVFQLVAMYNNKASELVAKEGYYIRFRNGEEAEIIEVSDFDYNYMLQLDYDGPINYYKCGSLEDAVYLAPDGGELPKGYLEAYISQYGLQGKILRHLSKLFADDKAIDALKLLCAIVSAGVFTMITILIGYKYDTLMAFCFGLTFLLSPWIVSFSRSLYWAVYLWFIPMAIGLFVSMKYNNRLVRYGGYVAAFFAILFKSLCGYELITSIMMGLIAFLLVDLVVAIVNKDKGKAFSLFKIVFVFGVVSLAGFFTAICIHANLRGEGDIIAGIKHIFEEDVLRRVGGGSLNVFDTDLWESLNASIWDVVKMYFTFSTDVITGIKGELFPILCIIPIILFVKNYVKNKLDIKLIALYVILFITGISWIVLCKSHSYVHIHVNFVIWYFGFVQICIYITVKEICDLVCRYRIVNRRGEDKHEK